MSILNVVHNVHPALQADHLQVAQKIEMTKVYYHNYALNMCEQKIMSQLESLLSSITSHLVQSVQTCSHDFCFTF